MEKKLIDVYSKIYGKRLNDDNTCVFCKKLVEKYCNCTESSKINIIAKRIYKKLNDFYIAKTIGIIYKNNVPDKYSNAKISLYRTKTEKEIENLEKIKKYHDDMLENFITGKNLILIGNFGTAKSFLLSALCNHCNNLKLTSKFINLLDLASEIQESFFYDGTKKNTNDIFKKYISYDFLVIDDIDKDLKTSDFVKELFYKIINSRYESIKPTAISSNNNINILEKKFFGEATISRLIENSEIIYFYSENERYK